MTSSTPLKKYKNICPEQVFRNIYDSYAKTLHDRLYYGFGQHCHPKDKVQDAFIKLWENCRRVKTIPKARAYVFTIAKNMILNDFRHQKVVLQYKRIIPKSYTTVTPETLMENKQFFKKYQEALSKLPEEQRTAFLLNKVEGKTHKEIAEMLGISRRTVESRIYTAFKKLKETLKEFLGDLVEEILKDD